MLFGDLFIVNVDGRDVQYVSAPNKNTGKTVWKTTSSADFTDVPVNKRKAYSMPSLIEHNTNCNWSAMGLRVAMPMTPKPERNCGKSNTMGSPMLLAQSLVMVYYSPPLIGITRNCGQSVWEAKAM